MKNSNNDYMVRNPITPDRPWIEKARNLPFLKMSKDTTPDMETLRAAVFFSQVVNIMLAVAMCVAWSQTDKFYLHLFLTFGFGVLMATLTNATASIGAMVREKQLRSELKKLTR